LSPQIKASRNDTCAGHPAISGLLVDKDSGTCASFFGDRQSGGEFCSGGQYGKAAWCAKNQPRLR
jgi:hypothetical protein